MPTDDLQAIATELIARAREDLALREELGAALWTEGYHPRMRALHDRNAAYLAAVLEAHGWPSRSRVGERAGEAAWLILQHAIGHPALQRRGLALIQGMPAGEVPPAQVAMLEDRIRTSEGRGQRYGTQFDWDEAGELSPLPLEDPRGVDQRRAQVGLGPLAEAVARHRAAALAAGQRPPTDWAERRRAQEAWLREVGWRR